MRVFFFFFKQKTAYEMRISDWSSDVCSSDLRFREAYYWDTAFGIDGLIATGRLELAQMQADNFLELIRRFGFVPNGNRDYYLSRSQIGRASCRERVCQYV